MELLIEWIDGKKEKVQIADDRKEEVSNALKTPWVNITLVDEANGANYYLFHAKKISWKV